MPRLLVLYDIGEGGGGGGVALSLDLSFDMHVNISTQHFHLKVIVFDKRVMMHNERLHIKYQKFRTNDSQVASACYLQSDLRNLNRN